MRFEEFGESKPEIGDILEVELGDEIVETVIVSIKGDTYIVETDSDTGHALLESDQALDEKAPPGMEDWIKSRKADFKKRYGDRWQEVLYATAWKRKNNESLEEDLTEVSLGDYRKKAQMQKAQSQMGAMFGQDPEKKARDLATFYKREKGLERVKARDEKARAADQQKQLADLVARLPELEAEYADMQKKYKALGGSDWQYADREQNLTPAEREARSMEGPMNNLWRQIQAAKKAQGVTEGYGKYYCSTDKKWKERQGPKQTREGLEEAEYQGRDVKLGKPTRGDVKKFKVYVRNPKTGKIIKVNFGDPDMKIKKSNPKRRKSFRARHNCSNPGPRTKARYWSCRKW